jgi:hypothetical protein
MKPEVLKPKYLRPGDLRLERNQTKNMIREIPGQRLCVGVRVKNRPFLRDEKLVKSLHERLPLPVRPGKGKTMEGDFQQVKRTNGLIKFQHQINIPPPRNVSVFRPTNEIEVPNNQLELFRGHIDIREPVKKFDFPMRSIGRVNISDNPGFIG